jgi:hypothetical protein
VKKSRRKNLKLKEIDKKKYFRNNKRKKETKKRYINLSREIAYGKNYDKDLEPYQSIKILLYPFAFAS